MCRPLLSAPRAPQSPVRQNRTGLECLVILGCGWARTRPDDVDSNLPPRTVARIGDCQDFRVWAGIMGKKESHYVPTQGTGDTG